MEAPQINCSCFELIKQTNSLMQHYHTVGLLIFTALYKTHEKLATMNRVEKEILLKDLQWSINYFNKYKRKCTRVYQLVTELGFGSLSLSTVISVTDLEEIPNGSWKDLLQDIKDNDELTTLFSSYEMEGYSLRPIIY